MIDMDKMVEVVAEEIRSIDYHLCPHGCSPEAPCVHCKLANEQAKAAIKVFCKELPQLNKEDYDDLAQYYNESKLYQDLLEYGKDA